MRALPGNQQHRLAQRNFEFKIQISKEMERKNWRLNVRLSARSEHQQADALPKKQEHNK